MSLVVILIVLEMYFGIFVVCLSCASMMMKSVGSNNSSVSSDMVGLSVYVIKLFLFLGIKMILLLCMMFLLMMFCVDGFI